MTSRDDSLAIIFREQAALQTHMGTHPSQMDDAALTEYIRLNILALTDELHEALGEVNWKPWASVPPGFRSREKFAAELADCMHFLVNLCLAGGLTADDALMLYQGKNARDHQRQDSGYTGLDKCDRCHRELDDMAALIREVRRHGETLRFCSAACMESYLAEEEEEEGQG